MAHFGDISSSVNETVRSIMAYCSTVALQIAAGTGLKDPIGVGYPTFADPAVLSAFSSALFPPHNSFTCFIPRCAGTFGTVTPSLCHSLCERACVRHYPCQATSCNRRSALSLFRSRVLPLQNVHYHQDPLRPELPSVARAPAGTPASVRTCTFISSITQAQTVLC